MQFLYVGLKYLRGASLISIQTALNYYSQWLVQSCGTYSPEIWQNLWLRSGKKVVRHFQNVYITSPECLATLKKTSSDVLFCPDFFEDRECKNLGVSIRTIKPVLQFPDKEVELRYNVGTRSNGTDEPRWPKDLLVPIISSGVEQAKYILKCILN